MKSIWLFYWIGVCTISMAQSVASEFVPVCKPGNVFDPIVEEADGRDAAQLVDTTNTICVAHVKDFAIDGDPAKGVWKSVPSVGTFVPQSFRRADSASSSQTETEVKLAYSASALYIGATLHQPMSSLYAEYDQDDQPVYNDDNLEVIFLIPSGKGANLLHVAVNALGSCFDACNGRRAWNVKGREVKVRQRKDFWSLEMKLPFSGLRMDRPVAGDFIGVRFCRHVKTPRINVSFPKMMKVGNDGRHSLAKLVFGEPYGRDADDARAYRARVVAERAAERLLAARSRLKVQQASSELFADASHPAYATAVQAVCQMKCGLDDFERGALPTNDFIALDRGFRKYVGEHAYAAWIASPWEKGDPHRMPPAACSTLPRLRFEQAGNEREEICLEFTGLMCGPRLDIRLVPQTVNEQKGKRFVSCDSFEVYEEPFVLFEKDLITAPLVAKAGNAIAVSPGKITRVWVVFNSRGVKPGDYRSRILIKPSYDTDVSEKSLDVEMKVWGFALPETRDWPFQTFFWGPNYFDNDETCMLKLMHDHHVTHGWTKSQLYKFGIDRDRSVARPAGKDASAFFDRHLAETANEEFFRTAKALGMRFVFGWNSPSRTPEWFHVMDKRMRGMGFVPGDYIFKALLKDEFQKKSIPNQAEARAAVTRDFGTNLWFQAVYLSTPPPTGATMEDIEAAHLPEFFKMWTVVESVFRDPARGADVTRRLRAKGCQVWSYNCQRYMQTQDILNYYRFYLWKCFMRGLDGAAMWTSGGRTGDDGWDSRDGYDDGILWCGNNKQQIPTKRFEAFREGLEDVAYMDLLFKAMAKRTVTHKDGVSSRTPYAAALDKAQSLLDARESIIKAHSQKMVDDWRLDVGRTIDELMR